MLRAFCLCFNSLSRGIRRDSSLGEGANPLRLLPMVAASSPEGGALFALTVRCIKAPPLGGAGIEQREMTERVRLPL